MRDIQLPFLGVNTSIHATAMSWTIDQHVAADPGPATIPAVTVAATMRGNVAPTLCLDPGQQPLRIL